MPPAGKEICLDLGDFQHNPERLEGFLRNLLREIESQRKVEFKEVTRQREFDMSTLNGDFDISTLVIEVNKTALKTDFEKSALNIEFEKALRYVELSVPADPIFTPREVECLNVTGRPEVVIVLYWLKEIKGVKRIHELCVRDSLYHPHMEETIEKIQDYYSIDVLDWRRPDISIDTVERAAKHVQELYLYGTGWASLSHWTGDDGVGMLPSVSPLSFTAQCPSFPC
jgi:hypothetical protein